MPHGVHLIFSNESFNLTGTEVANRGVAPHFFFMSLWPSSCRDRDLCSISSSAKNLIFLFPIPREKKAPPIELPSLWGTRVLAESLLMAHTGKRWIQDSLGTTSDSWTGHLRGTCTTYESCSVMEIRSPPPTDRINLGLPGSYLLRGEILAPWRHNFYTISDIPWSREREC